MNHETNDAFDTSLDDHDGPLPTGLIQDQHARPLRATLAGRRSRLADAEERARELLSRIQDAESMRRHVPAFLERKLARVRDRIELLQGQVLSLEDQLPGSS